MKKLIKKITGVGMWAMLAAVCVACIFLGFGNPKMLSALILSTFFIFPVRAWTYSLLVWGIETLASNSEKFKKRIYVWATMNPLVSKKDDERKVNAGFYNLLKIAIWMLTIFVALLLWIFQGTSLNIVYAVCHSVVTIFKNLSVGNAWQRASVLFWIFGVFGGFWTTMVVMLLRIARGKMSIRRDIIISITAFVLSRIFTYLCLSYTMEMVWADICLWLLLFSPIVIFFLGSRLIRCIRKIIPKLTEWVNNKLHG